MQFLKKSVERKIDFSKETESTVTKILNDIKMEGDSAVKEYEKKFGKSDRTSLLVSDNELEEAISLLSEKEDRKSTRLNSSHVSISYAVFCLKKKKIKKEN